MWSQQLKIARNLIISVSLCLTLGQAAAQGEGPVAPTAPTDILIDNLSNPSASALPSQDYQDVFPYTLADDQGADDFTILRTEIWHITTVDIAGRYQNSGSAPPSVHIRFYYTTGNLPGGLAYEALNIAPPGGLISGTQTITLPTTATLLPGTHWLSVQARKDFSGADPRQWLWGERIPQTENPAVYRKPLGSSCTSWTAPLSSCFPNHDLDLLFKLNGTKSVPFTVFLPILRR